MSHFPTGEYNNSPRKVTSTCHVTPRHKLFPGFANGALSLELTEFRESTSGLDALYFDFTHHTKMSEKIDISCERRVKFLPMFSQIRLSSCLTSKMSMPQYLIELGFFPTFYLTESIICPLCWSAVYIKFFFKKTLVGN